MTSQDHVAMNGGAEFDAIRAMLGVWGNRAHGIGDDAAVLQVQPGQQLVASTDATIEGVHFRRGWLTGDEIGGRAAAAALSDLAAMGAAPLGLLLALALPDGWRGELAAIAGGVGRVASAVGCPIVGGNIASAPALSLTITVLGQAAQPLLRTGARPGDIIFVTGALGGPGAALRALQAGTPMSRAQRARFASPVPRVAEGQWLAAHGATSAIDISDGIVGDAGHVARASGVTLEIEGRLVPLLEGVSTEDALTSGEEYELLVTAPGTLDTAAFERAFGTRLTRIGLVTAVQDVPVRVAGAAAGELKGHDHLGARHSE